eukprot:scaffold56545_cov63-Phaeocystis_antarctica.AAC.6
MTAPGSVSCLGLVLLYDGAHLLHQGRRLRRLRAKGRLPFFQHAFHLPEGSRRGADRLNVGQPFPKLGEAVACQTPRIRAAVKSKAEVRHTCVLQLLVVAVAELLAEVEQILHDRAKCHAHAELALAPVIALPDAPQPREPLVDAETRVASTFTERQTGAVTTAAAIPCGATHLETLILGLAFLSQRGPRSSRLAPKIFLQHSAAALEGCEQHSHHLGAKGKAPGRLAGTI